MIKAGDKVVCIVNKSLYEINKIYEISDTQFFSEDGIYHKIFYGDKNYMHFWYHDRSIGEEFIPLSEWREQQIKAVLDD